MTTLEFKTVMEMVVLIIENSKNRARNNSDCVQNTFGQNSQNI